MKKEQDCSILQQPDHQLDQSLRPQYLSEFSGQANVVTRLQVLIGAATQRQEPASHILFSGPPGLGKTSLSRIIAKEMGSNITVTTGPSLKKPADLAGILTALNENDILFIDEIHSLNVKVGEYLYSAMEDFRLDIVIDSGACASSVSLSIKPFTLIAATTRPGLLSSPLLTRFLNHLTLDYYEDEILKEVVERSSKLLGVKMDPDALSAIAKRARGTPRICNNLVRWIRDYSQVKKIEKITLAVVQEASAMLSIDKRGLGEEDRKILRVIANLYNNGPVGLDTIAIATDIDSRTISSLYEPYLIKMGLIKITPRGRETTTLANKILQEG